MPGNTTDPRNLLSFIFFNFVILATEFMLHRWQQITHNKDIIPLLEVEYLLGKTASHI